MRPARRCGGDEIGAATVLVVAVAGLLLLVGAALGVVTALVTDHRRAQSAADLAALAGASALATGRGPCEEARRVALANDATLAACSLRGADVLVEVVVSGPRWWGWAGDPSARARAGPG
ncbi:MAG: Rv3654c family TadE-like protein [Nocardioidaceae bacterium]